MATQLDLAESQLIGFGHASKGYDIKDLANAMGLSKNEWKKLRENKYLKDSDREELDNLYKL